MSAVAELTTARIFQLILDDHDRSALVEVDTIEAPPNPATALSWWFDHADGEWPSALYMAELPDGSRTGLIRGPGPDPLRPAKSRALGAR